ncbi:MAG TPA: antibiotic biosynthesis monooxygenase [Mycobacteriales bacterium]|nr:antibiotic biosynthesis monooxygenase [Mycobacteriales bacterium]
MLVITRFTVPEADGGAFRSQAADALAALAERPGFRRGRVGRAADDAGAWVLVTEWDGVGAWRRALGGYDVKLRASPLLARSHDEPTTYEDIVLVDGTGTTTAESDRAPDADSVSVGRAAGPRQDDR